MGKNCYEKEKVNARKHSLNCISNIIIFLNELQNFVKTIAEQRGFKATLEENVSNGKVVVGLVKDNLKIAIEISVTNSVNYEVQNI